MPATSRAFSQQPQYGKRYLTNAETRRQRAENAEKVPLQALREAYPTSSYTDISAVGTIEGNLDSGPKDACHGVWTNKVALQVMATSYGHLSDLLPLDFLSRDF
jgi:hypothetical protein